ncbi:guanylyl cyclase [Cystobacter fuscus DSM 2262]|uniref:Guanylyl cyclase n=2 Tax=Cystobacter fuscus TaxID=43 RepID=S9Q0Z4_CYSF2|nr:guanylyl cyclase [Cystobacter fuscus DSM 2262]
MPCVPALLVRRAAHRPLPPEQAESGCFPAAVLLAAQEVGAGWLAELRRATVLFLRLEGLPEEASDELLPRLSDAVRAMQEAVYGLGGSVNQLLVDDEGLVLVAAFGLPTCAHEDDAARAVKAALQALATLRTQGLSASIGIATGRVCCGLRGGPLRHEYALMGRTVNLAARLMQQARDGVLFDEATAQALGERLWAERLPPVKVKGVAQPVPIFRPGGVAEARAHRANPHALVGRDAERALLDEALEGFARDQGGVLLPQAGAEPEPEEERPSMAVTVEEPKKERAPRLDSRRAAGQDVRAGRVRLRPLWRQAPGAGVPDGTRWGARDFGAHATTYAACEAGLGAGASAARVVLSARPRWPTGPSPLPRP